MKALIFDMDGVIIDSERLYEELDQAWFKEKGILAPLEEMRQCLGCTDDVNWKVLIDLNPHLDLTLYRKSYEQHCQRAEKVDYSTIFRHPVKQLLLDCQQQGIKTAVASSSPLDNIQKVLQDCDISDLFNEIISGHNLPRSKPDPLIFITCAQRLGVKNEDCYVIEDSVNGVLAAKGANMKVVGLEDPYFGLDLSKADVRIQDLSQIQIKNQNLLIRKSGIK